ncbi:hypothetical protein IAR50_000122 [Cryptococcus sp. DSM 104548]
MDPNARARTPAGPARKPKKKRPPSPLPPSTSPTPGPSTSQDLLRPVPRPYLARAPSPISNTPHNRLAEMVLPSSFPRPQPGPSTQILEGAAAPAGRDGTAGPARGQKKKKGSRYAQGLLAPPSIVPGGVPAAPRVQHQQNRDRRRGEDRLGRHAGGTTSQTRLQELPNQSQTSLGHLILGSDPVAVEQDPPPRRRRRIVRGEGEEGLRRRVTVSSREEGRALGVARGASMRRRNVWDEIPDQMAQETGEPPPPFPFPNAATARLPPAFNRSPLGRGDAGSQAGAGEEGRVRSPPPTWEQAVGLAPSPAPAPVTSRDQPALPTLAIPPTPLSTQPGRESSTERSASPASTRYESAPSSPFLLPSSNTRFLNLTIPAVNVSHTATSSADSARSNTGIDAIAEEDEHGASDGDDDMTEQERQDRRMWNADLLAGYTLEERVKREWERKVGRERRVGDGVEAEPRESNRRGRDGAEAEDSPVTEAPAIAESAPVASVQQEDLSTRATVEEDDPRVASPAVEPPTLPQPLLNPAEPLPLQTKTRPQTPPVATPVHHPESHPEFEAAPASVPSPKKTKTGPRKTKKKGKERADMAQEKAKMTGMGMGEKSPMAASSLRTPWSAETPVNREKAREREEVDEVPSRVSGPPKHTVVSSKGQDGVTAVRAQSQLEPKPSEKKERNESIAPRPLFQKSAWASSPELNQITTPAQGQTTSASANTRPSVTGASAAAYETQVELKVGRRKSEGNLVPTAKREENTQESVLPPSREAALKRRDLAIPKPTPALATPALPSPPKPPTAKAEKLGYGVSGPLINLDDSDPAPSSSASSIKSPQKATMGDELGTGNQERHKKRESNQSLWRLAASSADLLQLLDSGGDQTTSSGPPDEDKDKASKSVPVAGSDKVPPPIPPPLATRRKAPPPIPPRPHYVVDEPPPLPPRNASIPPPIPPPPVPKRRPPPPPPPRHPVAVAHLGLQANGVGEHVDETKGTSGVEDTHSPSSHEPLPTVSGSAPASMAVKRPLGPRPPPPPRSLRLRNLWTRENVAPPAGLAESQRPETDEGEEGSSFEPPLPPRVPRIAAEPEPAPESRLTSLPTHTSPSSSPPKASQTSVPRLILRPPAGRTQSDVPHPHHDPLYRHSAPQSTPSQAHFFPEKGGSEESEDTRVNHSASAVDLCGDASDQAGVGVDISPSPGEARGGLLRLPRSEDGPGAGVHSRAGPSVIREEREGEVQREYTDLDLFVARLDGSGREYEGFSQLTSFLGPSKPAAASPAALATLLPGLISVDSRRTTPQGKVKLKLSLLGVRVTKCPICQSQFKGGDKGVMVPGCGHAGHESCVRRWFREDGRCFVCREVLKEE